jgi:ribosome-associated protein
MDPEARPSETLPSKTQRKKEMLALQEIGSRLTRFSEAQLDKLTLSDKLRNAIREFRRLPNSHGAKRRQLQYIGRLMRDFNLDEIQRDIETMLQPPRRVEAKNAILQRYCEQILVGGDLAINEVLEENPQLERQVLRKHYLDFSKARNNDGETECNAVKSKLRDYLRDQLD